jgi:hypothetical protein
MVRPVPISHLSLVSAPLVLDLDPILSVTPLPLSMYDSRSLRKLTIGGDNYWNDEEWISPEPSTLEVGMAEVDFSKKYLSAHGAIIISTWILHKDIDVLSELNLSKNNLNQTGALTICSALLQRFVNTNGVRYHSITRCYGTVASCASVC